jgi:pheromone shutdown protein TraB
VVDYELCNETERLGLVKDLVIDFEKLSDVGTISGFYKNKVTHLLIVAALTNVGSIIGTIIALPVIIGLFI